MNQASLILCFPSSLLRLLCPAVQLSSNKRSMGRQKLWRALMWNSRTPSCFLREADRCDPPWQTLHRLPVIHHKAHANIQKYLCCSLSARWPWDHWTCPGAEGDEAGPRSRALCDLTFGGGSGGAGEGGLGAEVWPHAAALWWVTTAGHSVY